MIFSGGLACDTTGRTPSITVIHGKTTTVLEMEHNVIDFITLCESPYSSGTWEKSKRYFPMLMSLFLLDRLPRTLRCYGVTTERPSRYRFINDRVSVF